MLSAGVSLALDAPWALVAVGTATYVIDRTVIRREERYLRSLFGAHYDKYAKETRRWM